MNGADTDAVLAREAGLPFQPPLFLPQSTSLPGTSNIGLS